MIKIKRIICFCLLAVAVCLLDSCKSSKDLGGKGKVNTKELKEFVASMQKQELKFKTFTSRLNVELDMDGKTVGSRVEMKLVRDSAMQLSIQPLLGIEVFRMELTSDSIKVLDRINKRYVLEGYSALKEQFPIDFNFYNLQALFINRLFLPGEQDVEGIHYDLFNLEREGMITRLHTKDRMKLRYCFEADSEEKLLSTLITEATGRYSLKWKYTDFKLFGATQLFPQFMQVSFRDEGILKGGMDLSFSRIQLDKQFRMDFSIPSKYNRITFESILRMLKSK